MDSEEVFKALADISRRTLLDLLFERDGQTLSELQIHLPMTRFGCMKHLKILEEAGLITSRKVGREKYHYLNPVPIQLVYDRWVSKYARPWATGLSQLKYKMEEQAMTEKPTHVFEVYIRTTPELLWQALTDGNITPHYYMGSPVESSWTPGAAYSYHNPAGGSFIEGQVVEIDPPRRLVTTFRPVWDAEAASTALSTVTYEIVPVGTACKLTLTHVDLDPTSPLTRMIVSGWSQILSGLKTYLETGEPLVIAG